MGEEEISIHQYVVALCSACVEQKGRECHTPGCAFIWRSVAEEGWPLRNGSELDKHLFPTIEEYRDAALAALRERSSRADELLRECAEQGAIHREGHGLALTRDLLAKIDAHRKGGS